MKKIKIKNRYVGEGSPVFIIAEAGVNHNGRLDLALKLITAAKKAGADAVKFQTWRTENIIVRGTKKAKYQRNQNDKTDQFEMLKKLELSYDDFVKLNNYAKKIGITFFSTPDDEESLQFLVQKLRVPVIKVGSAELTNLPHLKKVASNKLPMIISTGMATLKNAKQAVAAIEKVWPNPALAILHCTTAYPTPYDETNLRVIQSYKKEFPKYVIGFSDHTNGTVAPAIAVGLGAKVIEKHFTLDNKLPGPDHKASLNLKDFTKMVSEIRLTEQMLGSAGKQPTAAEIKNKKAVQRFLVAACDIKKDETINEKMVTAKRTFETGGLAAAQLALIIGKKTRVEIFRDRIIKKTDLI